MDNINHDYIVKTVADFYNENDIHTAKTMLFGCCKDTALCFKSYRMDAAKLDCRDIITKMNEIGTECPTFVAKNVSLLPPTTADMFNLEQFIYVMSNPACYKIISKARYFILSKKNIKCSTDDHVFSFLFTPH